MAGGLHGGPGSRRVHVAEEVLLDVPGLDVDADVVDAGRGEVEGVIQEPVQLGVDPVLLDEPGQIVLQSEGGHVRHDVGNGRGREVEGRPLVDRRRVGRVGPWAPES